MPKILDNFIKEVKKLDKYLVLKEEKDDYLIIGIQIDVKLYKEIKSTFSNNQKITDKSIYVYFRIAFTKKDSKLQEFDYLPTLYFDMETISPPKTIKEPPLKRYTAERIPPKPVIYTYDEFSMLDKLEKFITQTYDA